MANVGGIAADHLRSFVERIERLEEEKAALVTDLRDVYAEAKSGGFDTKVIRKVIARRKLDQHDLFEQDELLDLYERAISGDVSVAPTQAAAE